VGQAIFGAFFLAGDLAQHPNAGRMATSALNLALLAKRMFCDTAAPAVLVRTRGAPAHRGAKPPGICHRGATNIIHLQI